MIQCLVSEGDNSALTYLAVVLLGEQSILQRAKAPAPTPAPATLRKERLDPVAVARPGEIVLSSLSGLTVRNATVLDNSFSLTVS